MGYKDYYEVLGVARTASPQEIQRRYRALAKRYHPDVSKERDAEARFKEIGEAYEVLRDEERRRLYDEWGPRWRAVREGREPPPGGAAASEVRFDFGSFGFDRQADLGAIFEQVFGGRGGPRGPRGPAGRRPSADAEATLSLGVAEAYRGGRRELRLPGSAGERRLKVEVPAGVRDGQRIRLTGQASGGAGDLYLRVRIRPEGGLRLEGDDIYAPLRVSPSEAVLGARVPFETLDGPVRLRVPPGSSTGRHVRLRGRGYPARGGGRGDLYAEIQVVVPREPSAEERALYEKLGEVSTFDPRGR